MVYLFVFFGNNIILRSKMRHVINFLSGLVHIYVSQKRVSVYELKSCMTCMLLRNYYEICLSRAIIFEHFIT